MTRMKLVKLLYLIDVEMVASRREPATDLRWVFFHYGPWAFELVDELEAMENREILTRPYKQAVLYVAAPGAPDADRWPQPLSSRVHRIVDRWAREDLNSLLDFVYFETEPMRQANRGEDLDLRLERQARQGRERYRALTPPDAPGDLPQRLERWRHGIRQKLVPAPTDAPREILDLPQGR